MAPMSSPRPKTKFLAELFPRLAQPGPDVESLRSSNDTSPRGSESKESPLQRNDRQRQLRSRKRLNVVQRETHRFSIDEEEILAISQEHDNYGDGWMKLKGLKRFDDCSMYGISDEKHKELVRKEITKLVDAATREGPYLFDSQGSLPGRSLEDFEDVESIMDQLFCNLAILKHDNDRISTAHTTKHVLESSIDSFNRSRKILLSRFGGGDETVQGAEPRTLEPRERNSKLYHALLDYILASVARLLLRCAVSRCWVKYTLAVLALWAVKMKLVAYDPSRYAKMSIANGEDAIDRVSQLSESKRMGFLKVKIRIDDQDKESEHDMLSTDTGMKTLYYERHTFFRFYLWDFCRYAMYSILDDDNLQKGISSASFETCTLVYKAGLEGLLTAVNQDRFGYVSFSSQPPDITNLYSGLLLLRTNLQGIETRNRDSIAEGPGHPRSVAATVKWDWLAPGQRDGTDEAARDRVTLLYSMDDILSVTIAQCLGTIYTAERATSMTRMVSSGVRAKDTVLPFSPPPKSFQAMFHIISEDRCREQREAKHQQLEDPDVQFLSYSPLRHGIRAGTNLKDIASSSSTVPTEAEERTRHILDKYKTHKREMDTWIISEDSITINCRRYVLTVMGIAVLVICGSLAVPFVVKDAISGVDPFQFATFTWVFTGFCVILAKSRFVSEWPWHHFLHGKIVCKSVSDVRDVSRIPAQMILMKLLHEESESILQTRGPFNGMFTRRSNDSSGFSINEPVKLSTMLASGFIVLKVANEVGEHLVCGDVRKGTKAATFSTDERETYLAYKDLKEDEELAESQDKGVFTLSGERWGAKGRQGKVFLLKKEDFWYKRVIGVYTHDSWFG